MITLYLYIFLNLILEFFPVSSSGHALLICSLANYFQHPVAHANTIAVLDYLLHGPTLVVLGIFFQKRLTLLYRLVQKKPKTIVTLLYAGVMAESITVFFYAVLIPMIKECVPLWSGFLITISLLWSLPFCIPFQQQYRFCLSSGLVLGLAQGIALIPGISRLGITFVAARWLGFPAYKALEVSFLIEAPLSLAAFFKAALYLVERDAANLLNLSVGLTMLVASFFSWVALGILHRLIINNTMWKISYYICFVALLTYFFIRDAYAL